MYGVKDMPEGFDKLREVRGAGYDKMDVIRQVQDMMRELRGLEEAWERKNWHKEYTKPEPFKRYVLRAARTVGYDAEGVKKLLASIEEKIVFMRKKIDVERDEKNWNQEWQDPPK